MRLLVLEVRPNKLIEFFEVTATGWKSPGCKRCNKDDHVEMHCMQKATSLMVDNGCSSASSGMPIRA